MVTKDGKAYGIGIEAAYAIDALELEIQTLQAKLEAANQLAQLNGEIAASLKDDREVLAAKLEIERKNRQAAQIENEALKTRLAKVIK